MIGAGPLPGAVAVAAAGLLTGGPPGAPPALPAPTELSAPPARAPHPLHLATAQVAVDGSRVVIRLRTFQNDLEAALARRTGGPSIEMAPVPGLDSLYLAWVDAHLDVVADGVRLRPTLAGSGEDVESGTGDTRIWWSLLAYEAAGPVRELGVRATILYDLFDDQRNVIRILHVGTDARRTLYFAAPDDDLRSVRFD